MELAKIQPQELVATNPRLQALAKSLGLRDCYRLVVRIQSALPSTFEQQVYVAAAAEVALPPEHFAKVLRAVVPDRYLIAADFLPKKVGKNLVIRRYKVVDEFLEHCALLLGKVYREYGEEFGMTIGDAVTLTLAYGEQAEEVLDGMLTNVEYLRRALNLRRGNERYVLRQALRGLVKRLHRADDGKLAALQVWDLFPLSG